MRIQHVNLQVDDLAPCVRFYRHLLGLETIATPEQGFPSQFFRFNADQELHMGQIPDDKPYRAHFCVVVDDFLAVFRRMKEGGAIDVEAWGKIRKLPSGQMQMFVRDPSGNLVEVASAPGVPIDLVDPLVDPVPGIYTR